MGLLSGVMLLALGALDDVQHREACRKVIAARPAAAVMGEDGGVAVNPFGVPVDGGLDPCGTLTGMLGAASLDHEKPPAAVMVDLAPTAIEEGTLGGIAQGGVASGAPSPGVGASTAVVSAPTGPRVLAEFRVNPGALFAGGVKSSRFADVVVSLPVPANNTTNTFDFVSVHARLNLLAFGSNVEERVKAAAKEKFAQFDTGVGTFDGAIEAGATKPECQKALVDFDGRAPAYDVIAKQCGVDPFVERRAKLHEATVALDAEVEKLRHDEDTRYLGLDLRVDTGDLKLTGLAEARGTTLIGAAAGGISFRNVELRGRLGVTAVTTSLTTTYTSEFGAGATFAPLLAGRRPRFMAGIEGRWNAAGGDPQQVRFVDLRLGIAVPLLDGTSLSLAVALPLEQSGRNPTVALTGNWDLIQKLLMPVETR